MNDAEIDALRRGAETPVLATAADGAGVAADLSDAFAQDPQFDWFIRDDRRRDEGRLALFRLLVFGMGLPGGTIQRPATGGAAAIWMPSEALGGGSFWSELRSLPTLLSATGLARFGRMIAMREAMDRHHPMERPHAYLWFLGVTERARGLGVGSRLLAAGLRDVDAQGRHAYLESSNPANVSLYLRHGFEVMEEFRARPDAPPLIAMWREAR